MSLSEVRRIAESPKEFSVSAGADPRLTDVTLQVAGTGDGMTVVIREGGSDPGARLCLLDGPACLGSGLTTFTASAGARGAWGFGVPCDGGGTETGYRMNIAGNIELAAPAHGLTVSPVGWGVLTREAPDLKGGGIAGSLARNPSHSNGRGSKLKMNQAFRTGGPGGRDALLVRDTLEKLAAQRQRRPATATPGGSVRSRFQRCSTAVLPACRK